MSNERTMYAYDIYWDVDMEEVLDIVDALTPKGIETHLEINSTVYQSMNEDQKHGFVYGKFRHCPALLDRLLELPDKVRIPEVLAEEYRKSKDASDITEYLSDVYGYCINGYNIKDEKENNKWEL